MRASQVLVTIRRLAELLSSKTSDSETLGAVIAYTQDRGKWQNAHGLFDQIRAKTSKAHRKGDLALEAQYEFEEACVKTLHNLGRYSAPFDPDSPFWIIPHALRSAELLGIGQQEVIKAILAEPAAGGNAG